MGRRWSDEVRLAVELAFGIAALCVLPLVAPLIDRNHLLVFHFAGPAYRLFAKVFLDWGALWGLLTVLLMVRRWQIAVRMGLVLLVPWLLLEDWSLIHVWKVPRGVSAALLLVAVAGTIAAEVSRRETNDRRVMELSGGVLKALSWSGCVVLLQMLYCGFAARGLDGRDDYGLEASGSGAGTRAGRVVVMLFDELSYAQVFERRGAEPELPAFAELARESVVFANVRPESDQTDRAVPALLSGLPVARVRASADGRQLAMLSDGRWTLLRGEETIFGDARRAGYRVGVSGWYNPYCRVLAGVLDACAWASPASVRDMGRGPETVVEDALQPFKRVWREVRVALAWPQVLAGPQALAGPPPGREDWLAAKHVHDYLAITEVGDRILQDGRLGFVFLHLPIPHPGGIYDRRTGRLGGVASPGGKTGYLDNLVLADRYLGHVRQLLEARGEWEGATVVVLGDHSWRTRTWRNGLEWTREDEAASGGGQFDDRPALLVKLGGAEGGAVMKGAFQERRLRALLAAVERGEVRTMGDGERWAAEGAAVRGSVQR